MDGHPLRLGIDVGSTTAKIAILNSAGEMVFSAYRRHHAETLLTLRSLLQEASQALGEAGVQLCVTGSAGLGVSEQFALPFIQEVVASAEAARQRSSQVKTLIDIGGEDAKLIFFNAEGQPDIRMNGACAGGTGAFIDQMATLLNVSLAELNTLAEKHTLIYPIASRCGVFAKTDVQSLLSREVAHEDIAASIFSAVVWQTLATLARGHALSPAILFAGGPLTFLPALKAAFVKALRLAPGDVLAADHTELLSALGAALASPGRGPALTLPALIDRLASRASDHTTEGRLKPLFKGQTELDAWQTARSQRHAERVSAGDLAGRPCFLGIDSGSTTTKLVLIDEQGRIGFDYYHPNSGNPIGAAQAGLEKLRQLFAGIAPPPWVARSVVTGYGEDLIRAAFGCDEGMVETLAHFRAARAFEPAVSFILDIGGQDMKAIFVRRGHIQNIEINEACSSGCGTFIETFARSLGQTVGDFALKACQAQAPCDLGTRCTVFMNSKVKQALREGAEVGNISAGLAYSVIKNALHKVLKITDTSTLGSHIVVQGGAFRNPAIHRALEALLEKLALCPDIAELMGAYGAALMARDACSRQGARPAPEPLRAWEGLAGLEAAGHYQKQSLRCQGCENKCAVTKLTFQNKNTFYTGNRCERIFSNRGRQTRRGENLVTRKRELLFDRPTSPAAPPKLTIGLPRALNLYENFPFWCTLLVECGFEVKLSDISSQPLFEKGVCTVMSENICFPAKLLHGHIYNLIEARVDRIFYPMVFYEGREFTDAVNCYNCPIVSGYPDVVRSAIDPTGQFGIPFDQPAITFQDVKLLKKACREYLTTLGVRKPVFERAFAQALAAQAKFKAEVRACGQEILHQAAAEQRLVVLLAARPYHLDPLVNHKIPEALADMGVDIITEDAVPLASDQALDNKWVLTQWEYLNRYYHAGRWAGQQANVELAQLNSFGCGPDAFAIDEMKDVLARYGKNHTVIRIDEIDSLGSARLRLRSMLEAWKEKQALAQASSSGSARRTNRLYQPSDRRKTILVPEFSRFCIAPIVRPVRDLGYNLEVLPSPDRESVQVGLKYTNNEICYPGIIVIGDAIKALQSGRYDPDEVIIGSWETGGQCRASNISCLLKKALVAAGFENIPVVTLSTRLRSINLQPGFKLNLAQYLYKALLGMVYTDAVSELYHATAVRERHAGEAWALADRYMLPFENGTMPLTPATVLANIRQAVAEFNCLDTRPGHLPKVGIVGEIYVKYNPFVNNEVAKWLMAQGLEVVLPPLLTFFCGSFIGYDVGVKERIRRPDLLWLLATTGQKYVQAFIDEAEAVLQSFRYHHPHRTITEISQTAKAAVHLTHQYGEGWLLSGEVGEYVRAGVQNVLCLQPFGCIANHVIAKGVAKRLKGIYSDLNLLFLDLDAGASEVNFLNRLHFFVEQAKRAGQSAPRGG